MIYKSDTYDRLLCRAVEGSLDAQQEKVLAAALQNDPRVRDRYLEYVDLHAVLFADPDPFLLAARLTECDAYAEQKRTASLPETDGAHGSLFDGAEMPGIDRRTERPTAQLVPLIAGVILLLCVGPLWRPSRLAAGSGVRSASRPPAQRRLSRSMSSLRPRALARRSMPSDLPVIRHLAGQFFPTRTLLPSIARPTRPMSGERRPLMARRSVDKRGAGDGRPTDRRSSALTTFNVGVGRRATRGVATISDLANPKNKNGQSTRRSPANDSGRSPKRTAYFNNTAYFNDEVSFVSNDRIPWWRQDESQRLGFGIPSLSRTWSKFNEP